MYVFLVLALLLIPAGTFIKSYLKWKKCADIVNRIPGPKSYPVFGTLVNLLFVPREKRYELSRERIEKFKPFFRTWMGIVPEIHVMDCKMLEEILTSTVHIDKGYAYNFAKPWFGNGLLLSTGNTWHTRRKIITPTMHFNILKTFLDIFSEKSEMLVKNLEPVADGQVIDLCPFVSRCALDIICRTAMGVEVNSMQHKSTEYVQAIYDMKEIILHRIFKPWLVPDMIFYGTRYGKRFKECLRVVHGFGDKVISERKEVLKKRKFTESRENTLTDRKERKPFLDHLLEASENGGNLSNQDIREEVDTFIFAGQDTTAASITWALFLLGHHPDIQDKVIEELNSIFGNSNRAPTFQDLSEMKYLERVIKESMRIYPTVPTVRRQLRQNIELNGYEIPRGCTLIIRLQEMHQNPEYFPDPFRFNPDRFLPEQCKERHPFAFIPFSAGPRNCIGQKYAILQDKVIISTLLRNFCVKSVERPEDIKFYSEIILSSQTGIQVQLTPRKNENN